LIIASLGVFIVKYAGPPILKSYVRMGVGDCRRLPVLCVSFDKGVYHSNIDEEFISLLAVYSFPGMEIRLPKNFLAVKEKINKVYYKRRKVELNSKPTAYLLSQPPGFFVNLFPEVKRFGVESDYQFYENLLASRYDNLTSIKDAFFIIMKSIFTPDLGPQEDVKMIKAEWQAMTGFISYNLSGETNYFDCNLFDKAGNYSKVYIKDKNKELTLQKVYSIISTLKTGN
jgi:hypothetical protein